jgi:hypothetical protein
VFYHEETECEDLSWIQQVFASIMVFQCPLKTRHSSGLLPICVVPGCKVLVSCVPDS